MICAIHQPQYLPWLGFFSKLDAADVFVIYDDTQYKHDEWQNRNRIKTGNPSDPVQWLTVPVHHSQEELIREIRVDNSRPWPRKHSNALATNYGRAPFYKRYADDLAAVYAEKCERLAKLNIELIKLLCQWLGIATPLTLSSELGCEGRSTEALISICKAVGADAYLSGPGGRNYLEAEKFEPSGVQLLFHDFTHPAYPQQFGDFVPGMSVLDLLFNCGPGSLAIIRGGRNTVRHSKTEPQEAI